MAKPDSGGSRRRFGRRWSGLERYAALVVAGSAVGAVAAGGGAGVPSGAITTRGPAGSCGSCHPADPLFSHPVDVVPSMSVPERLPLDGGRVTCATCHETPDGLTTGCAPSMRVDPAGGQLCTQCHDPLATDRVSLHALALGRAHLPATGPRAWGWIRSAGDEMDTASIGCLECHDGSVATAAGAAPVAADRRRSVVRAGPLAGDHSVGVEYHGRGGRDVAVPLKEHDRLDPRIRLFGNRVGCGSCHSPFSDGPALLVMSNEGSALCLECHDY